MQKLSIYSKKLDSKIELDLKLSGNCLAHDSWTDGGWNNYSTWLNGGWSNFNSWMHNGWNNY